MNSLELLGLARFGKQLQTVCACLLLCIITLYYDGTDFCFSRENCPISGLGMRSRVSKSTSPFSCVCYVMIGKHLLESSYQSFSIMILTSIVLEYSNGVFLYHPQSPVTMSNISALKSGLTALSLKSAVRLTIPTSHTQEPIFCMSETMFILVRKCMHCSKRDIYSERTIRYWYYYVVSILHKLFCTSWT